MEYDDLNDVVLATSGQIEQRIDRNLSIDEKCALNDKLTQFLQEIGVDVSDD